MTVADGVAAHQCSGPLTRPPSKVLRMAAPPLRHVARHAIEGAER
jgi:hypothetical protein